MPKTSESYGGGFEDGLLRGGEAKGAVVTGSAGGIGVAGMMSGDENGSVGSVCVTLVGGSVMGCLRYSGTEAARRDCSAAR